MNDKELKGVTGFDVFSLGSGRELHVVTVDAEKFEFSLNKAFIDSLILHLQNPMSDYRKNQTVQPSGTLGAR